MQLFPSFALFCPSVASSPTVPWWLAASSSSLPHLSVKPQLCEISPLTEPVLKTPAVQCPIFLVPSLLMSRCRQWLNHRHCLPPKHLSLTLDSSFANSPLQTLPDSFLNGFRTKLLPTIFLTYFPGLTYHHLLPRLCSSHIFIFPANTFLPCAALPCASTLTWAHVLLLFKLRMDPNYYA